MSSSVKVDLAKQRYVSGVIYGSKMPINLKYKIDKNHTQASNDIRVSMLSSRARKEARKLHTTETIHSVSTLMVIQRTFMFTTL